MKFLFCSVLMFLSFQAEAAGCRERLLTLLQNAKGQVSGVLAKDTGCYNAAMIGRKNGPPGCFPPELNTLLGVLTPAFDSAKNVCNTTCKDEGKKDLCLAATNKNKLKQEGIDGIVTWIKANITLQNATFTPNSESTTPPAPVEI